jgi:hypothetical protein
LSKFSKEDYGSKTALFPTTTMVVVMMMMIDGKGLW